MNKTITNDAQVKWNLDVKHSEINFTIYQSIFTKIEGRFKDFGGTIVMDDNEIPSPSVDLWINPNSIWTETEPYRNYLLGSEILDSEKYKIITYDGVSLERTSREFLYKAEGSLTMKNMANQVTFNVDFIGEMIDPYGRHRMGVYVTGLLSGKLWNMFNANQFGNPINFISSKDIAINAKFQFVKDID